MFILVYAIVAYGIIDVAMRNANLPLGHRVALLCVSLLVACLVRYCISLDRRNRASARMRVILDGDLGGQEIEEDIYDGVEKSGPWIEIASITGEMVGAPAIGLAAKLVGWFVDRRNQDRLEAARAEREAKAAERRRAKAAERRGRIRAAESLIDEERGSFAACLVRLVLTTSLIGLLVFGGLVPLPWRELTRTGQDWVHPYLSERVRDWFSWILGRDGLIRLGIWSLVAVGSPLIALMLLKGLLGFRINDGVPSFLAILASVSLTFAASYVILIIASAHLLGWTLILLLMIASLAYNVRVFHEFG